MDATVADPGGGHGSGLVEEVREADRNAVNPKKEIGGSGRIRRQCLESPRWCMFCANAIEVQAFL